MLTKKVVSAKSTFIEKKYFLFSNAYNVISTYPLLTYVPTNIFTVQLPFFRLHRERLQCHFDSSTTAFGHFWTYPSFASMSDTSQLSKL